jgi:exosortase/archaeosortase family protein
LLSYLNRASARRTLVNGVVAALLVLIANIVRNTLLYFPEAGLVDWPSAAHEAIGIAAFAGAIVPLTFAASWRKQ